MLYIILFCHFLLNKEIVNRKDELKKWVFSAIALFVCYLPWLFILIGQTTSKHSNGITTFDMFDFLSCLTSFTVFDVGLIFNVVSLLFLIMILSIAFKKYLSNKTDGDNQYIIMGLLLFLSTIILGSVVLPLFFGSLTIRYLVPIYGVIWLVIAVLLGTVKDKRIFTILTILVIILACCNFVNVIQSSDKLSDTGIKEVKILDKMNSNDSMVIYTQRFHYACYHNDLNKTKEYALMDLNVVYSDDYEIEDNIDKILKDNPKSKVFIIKNVDDKKDKDFGKNIKSEVIGGRGHTKFIQLSFDKK